MRLKTLDSPLLTINHIILTFEGLIKKKEDYNENRASNNK